MEIIEIYKNNLNEIEDLWNELNSHHKELSINFKDHFDRFTFKERSDQLLKKEQISIFVAQDEERKVGYCIVSIHRGIGEIDSIYIAPDYQGKGIGHDLMEKALDWLSKMEITSIKVYVAEGNDTVLPFYEKYGLKKRFTVLQLA